MGWRKWIRVWLAGGAMVIVLGGVVTSGNSDVMWLAIATACLALALFLGEDWP
jgi:hypothetical protein